MEIDREEIYTKYMEWVNKVSDEFDWKTSFKPKEIVYKICELIEDYEK
jgi:hypothetical protein